MEQELAIRLQEDRVGFQTQVEIPVTTADFYFPMAPRPLLVDGPVHLKRAQMIKDEETRSLLRRKGYMVLELFYEYYANKKKEQLYQQITDNLRKAQ